jgi:16S rRNA C967 or C1407 C5-methylase (RsmB/RsmF family)
MRILGLMLPSMCSLLDPSCSGSGIVNRLDHLLETGVLSELLSVCM